ncbi:MAG: mechanosensitive ion channel family protein, partial [Prochloraceae cyanobacterium]|nr:mechanosensitive ion channel family protein [Prochloraceae cyanobacterium]
GFMYKQTISILIVLAEIFIPILVLILINFLLGKGLNQLMKISWFNREENRAKIIKSNIQLIFILSCVVLCIVILGFNGYLLYRGEDIREYKLTLIRSIPKDFWIQIGIASAKCLSILVVAGQGVKFIHYLLSKTCYRVKIFDKITANDESVEAFFRLLKNSIRNSIWLLAIAQCSIFLAVPKLVTQNIYLLLRIYLIAIFGLLIVKATAAIIDSLDAFSNKYSNEDNLLWFYKRLRHLVPFLKRCLEYVIYVLMATSIAEQVQPVSKLAVYGPVIVRIVAIILMSRVFIEVAKLTVEQILIRNQNLSDFERQRRLTFLPLIQSGLKYIIYFGAGIIVLYTININPTPILAGAGILGLAVSLGAQNLINDLVSGFFIIFENYYLVGDFIETNDSRGIVESIELRTTRIRHPSGQLYIIRNGDIAKIVNYSKGYIYAVVQVGVDYDSDLDRVYQVIEKVGKQLKEINPNVLEPTKVDGLDNFGESELTIRTATKVRPGKHLPVERVLRKMLKTAFDREGIEIPFARRVLIFKNSENSDLQPENNLILQGSQDTPNERSNSKF